MTGPGSSTFMVIDFFDYESQTTSLISGKPGTLLLTASVLIPIFKFLNFILFLPHTFHLIIFPSILCTIVSIYLLFRHLL